MSFAQGYTSRVHPVVVPPDAGDEEARSLVKSALLSCGGDNVIPVEILDRYNTLENTLRLLVTEFDLDQVGSGSFALCVDKDTKEALGLENTCYGKYIDDAIVKDYLSGSRIGKFTIGCTAALMACELKRGLVAGLATGAIESAAVCGIPAATAFSTRDKIAEELKKGGESFLAETIPFTGGWSGIAGGFGVFGSEALGLTLINRARTQQQLEQVTAQRVAELYLQMSEETAGQATEKTGTRTKVKGLLSSFIKNEDEAKLLVDRAYVELANEAHMPYLLLVDDPKVKAKLLANITKLSGEDLSRLSLICSPGLGDPERCVDTVKKIGTKDFSRTLENTSGEVLTNLRNKIIETYRIKLTEKLATEEVKATVERLKQLEAKADQLTEEIGKLETKIVRSNINPQLKLKILEGKELTEGIKEMILKELRSTVENYLQKKEELKEVKAQIGIVLDEFKTTDTSEKVDDAVELLKKKMGDPPQSPEELESQLQRGIEAVEKSDTLDEATKKAFQDIAKEEGGYAGILNKLTNGLWDTIKRTYSKVGETKKLLQKIDTTIKKTYQQRSFTRELLESVMCAGLGYVVGTVSAALPGTTLPTIQTLTLTYQNKTLTFGGVKVG